MNFAPTQRFPLKNTKQIQGRRTLRFHSLDEMLVDIEQLTSGPIQALGNGSPGQIFEHLARAYTLPLSGVVLPIPFDLRWGAKLMLGKFLRDGLPAGLKLSGKSAEAHVPDAASTEVGLTPLRDAVARWKVKTAVPYHSVFGSVTDEQVDADSTEARGTAPEFLVSRVMPCRRCRSASRISSDSPARTREPRSACQSQAT